VLYGTPQGSPKLFPDYPWGYSPEACQAYAEDIDSHWGEGALGKLLFVAVADVPGFREEFGKIQRFAATPMMARLLWRAVMKIDVRAVLDAVRTPTLVLTRHGDVVAPMEGVRLMAAEYPTPNTPSCRPHRTLCSTMNWVPQ
jgi:pimeloyl-ACP methyl ester carboxylesterase